MSLHPAFLTLALLVLCVTSGCTDQPEQITAPIIRTENGVRIVENQTLAADSTSWRFNSIPQVVIGDADGSDEYIIGRLAGYMRRPDGSILIGDGISQAIRQYDASGKFIARIGRAGDGPGEFRVLASLSPHVADSVLIVDYEGNRGTILDPQLRYVRSFRVRLQDGRKASHFTSDGIADVTGDGNLLMYDYLNVCGATRMNGFCEDSMALFRTDITGASPKALGRFVYGRQQTTIVTRLHHVSFSEPHPQVFRRTLGARTYVADAKRFEIRVFDADGKLEMIVRAPYSQRHYGRAELFPKVKRSAATDSTIAATARAMDELREVAEIPDSLPQFSDMLIDHAGNIWINEYAPPAKRVGPTERWLVFSPDGVLTHIVRAPLDLRGMAGPWLRSYARIGADHAITSRRDADGVESVLVYTLIKGAR